MTAPPEPVNKNTITPRNPHLPGRCSDFLYHINIAIPDTKNTTELQQKFGNVKFICMGGTARRMLELARFINAYVYDGKAITDDEYVDLTGSGDRFVLYKVRAVLCASHGMGGSSISIILHELIKLCYYAGCIDPIFIRVGTCGGVGVEPGTVVVSSEVLNGYLNPEHEHVILGNKVTRPTALNEEVICDILRTADPDDRFQTISGITMSTDCFYEGQGRLDGAACEHTEQDKLKFLKNLHERGVRNIEMEGQVFSSLTNHMGIKAAIVCVAIVNRMLGDQVTTSKEELREIEVNSLIIVGRYIKEFLEDKIKPPKVKSCACPQPRKSHNQYKK